MKTGFLIFALLALSLRLSLSEEPGPLVDPDGSGFRFFKTPARDQGWFSLAWAPDSKSIFCQDLENLCRFDVNGELLASWEISKIIPKGDQESSH
jgi:hypothetical protein